MLEILEKLSLKYGYDKVYIIRMGAFFTSFDFDGFILENILKLKRTKFTNNTYKVGFPVNSLKKYTDILIKENISFYVLDYVQEKNLLSEYIMFDGKEYEIKYKFKSDRKINIDKIDVDKIDGNNIIETLYILKLTKGYIKKIEDKVLGVINGSKDV